LSLGSSRKFIIGPRKEKVGPPYYTLCKYCCYVRYSLSVIILVSKLPALHLIVQCLKLAEVYTYLLVPT
jgi:hypothetical protein